MAAPPITTTTLFPPPLRDSDISLAMQLWFFTLQVLLPLNVLDTSAGPQTYALPAAGLNASTGQSAQNMEITFIKDTADANTVTITGARGGTVVLVAQDEFVRFKSDGTNWRRIS